jgi:hypothetical protein
MDRFEELKNEVRDEMDLEAIWEDEYKSLLAEEIADEVRAEARKQAEADIRKRSASRAISR